MFTNSFLFRVSNPNVQPDKGHESSEDLLNLPKIDFELDHTRDLNGEIKNHKKLPDNEKSSNEQINDKNLEDSSSDGRTVDEDLIDSVENDS